MDGKLLEKLLANTSFALIVVGIFLIIIGAAGGFPSLALQVPELGWRIALAMMGAVVAAVGGLLYWRERNASTLRSCDSYGLRIDAPRPGEEIDEEYQVSGVYLKKPPKGTHIQLFHAPPDEDSYWPMMEARVTFDEVNKTWHTPAWSGGVPGPREVMVAVMGEAGQALCKYYYKVGKETGRWPSITTLTPDIIPCDRVSVVRK